MSTVFIDELDNLRLKASDAQKLQHAADQARDAANGERRLAEDRAAKLEAENTSLLEQLQTQGRKLGEFANLAAKATKAEEDCRLATDRSTKAEKKLSEAKGKIIDQAEIIADLSEQIKLVNQTLIAREDEFSKAQKALEAFRQRLAADEVIASL